MLGLFAVVLVRTAWVSDDAYITFRTVDNFLAGYGLRWNVGERVQTYTHPLWMFLVSGATAVLREPYYASLALAFVCTMSALDIVRAAGGLVCSDRHGWSHDPSLLSGIR